MFELKRFLCVSSRCYTFLTISNAILNYQTVGNNQVAGSYQPLGSDVLVQCVSHYLTISSKILNYQPVGNYQVLRSYQSLGSDVLAQDVTLVQA